MAIDRTELRVKAHFKTVFLWVWFQAVCCIVGVVLTLTMLVPLCWMVADILLIARFLVQPPPKPSFVAYLYILGWSKWNYRLPVCLPVSGMGTGPQPGIHLFGRAMLEGNYLFTGVVSVTLNFYPQGRNVNDVMRGKVEKSEAKEIISL